MKITGRVLFRIAYDAVLSTGMKAEDFDLQISRYRDEENRKWYSLHLEYVDGAYNRQATVYYGCADDDNEKTRKAIRQFRWVLKHKARSILKRQRVKRQSFYDAIWYSASMTLNENPLVSRWYVVDQAVTGDRMVVIEWSKSGVRYRTDMLKFGNSDFEAAPMEMCEAISQSLKQVSAAAELDSLKEKGTSGDLPKSNANVRRRW